MNQEQGSAEDYAVNRLAQRLAQTEYQIGLREGELMQARSELAQRDALIEQLQARLAELQPTDKAEGGGDVAS